MKKIFYLVFAMLFSTISQALDPSHFTITRITAPYFVVDGNSPATLTKAYVGFEVKNTSATTYSGLLFTITSIGTSVSGQNYTVVAPVSNQVVVGTLAPGSTKTCYFYVSYPANVTPIATFNVRLSDATVNDKIQSFNIYNRSSISANAGGLAQQSINNQDILGGIIIDTVTYTVGNVQNGDESDFQIAVSAQFDPTKMELISTRVVQSSVPGIPLGTTDSLYFITGNGSVGATIRVAWRFSIKSFNFTNYLLPVAGSTSGNTNYKYALSTDLGAGVPITISQNANSLSIKKTSDKVNYLNCELATFTLTVKNTGGISVSIDSLVDQLPDGFTYQSISVNSDVTTSNSVSYPSAGSTGNLKFIGGVEQSSVVSYRIPAGDSIRLIYTATAPCSSGSNKNSTAKGYVGSTEFGNSQMSVNVVESLPVQDIGDYRTKANNAKFSDPANWEYDNGTSFVQATQPPGPGNNVEVRHNTNMDVDFTTGSGKNLNITGGSLTVDPAKTYTCTGNANFGGNPVTFKSSAAGTGSMGVITGNLTGANNVTVEKYFQSRRRWRAVCAPLIGSTNNSIYYNWQNNGVFSSGTGALIWSNVNVAPRTELETGIYDCGAVGLSSMVSFDSDDDNWPKILNTKNTVLFDNNRNYPFLLFVTGNYNQNGDYLQLSTGSAPTTLKANGTLKKGPMNYNNAVANGKYFMFGNPFASKINLANVTRSGFDNFVYIWVPGNGDLGGFETRSLSEEQIIESGQAFFLFANNASNSVVFDEDDKISSSTNPTTYFRSSSNTRTAKISVELNKYIGNTTNLFDKVNCDFISGGNQGIDAYDANKFSQFAENISIISNDKDLSYETRPELTGNETIQFRIWGMKQADYQLKINLSNINIPVGYSAILQDAFLNKETVLNLNGTTLVDFNVSTNATSFDQQRFRIVFRSNVITSSINLDAEKDLAVYPNPVVKGKDVQVAFKNRAAGVYNITVYTITGVQVQRSVIRHSGGSAIQNLVLDQKLNAGNYLLELTNEKGEREHTKLVIQ